MEIKDQAKVCSIGMDLHATWKVKNIFYERSGSKEKGR